MRQWRKDGGRWWLPRWCSAWRAVTAMVGIVVETVIEKIEQHTTEEWGLSVSRRE